MYDFRGCGFPQAPLPARLPGHRDSGPAQIGKLFPWNVLYTVILERVSGSALLPGSLSPLAIAVQVGILMHTRTAGYSRHGGVDRRLRSLT